jgi:hypothetical protein
MPHEHLAVQKSQLPGYQLIDQLNFVPNNFLEKKKKKVLNLVPGTGLPAHCENTQRVD